MAEPEVQRSRFARNAGLGCFLMIPGFFGGGMLGVTVAWIVTGLTRCTAPADLPACNMWPYLALGAIAGAIVLPSIVLWRVGRRAPVENSERS